MTRAQTLPRTCMTACIRTLAHNNFSHAQERKSQTSTKPAAILINSIMCKMRALRPHSTEQARQQEGASFSSFPRTFSGRGGQPWHSWPPERKERGQSQCGEAHQNTRHNPRQSVYLQLARILLAQESRCHCEIDATAASICCLHPCSLAAPPQTGQHTAPASRRLCF